MIMLVTLRRLGLLLAFLYVAAVPAGAQTQLPQYPSRQIHWIVPYTPGAGSDTVARLLAMKLSESLGQSIVVENHGGAGGAIGTAIGARAKPDGYTWTFGSDPPFTINSHLRKLQFDPMKDFVPVSLIARVPLVLVVNPKLGVNTIQELVALAKKHPGDLTGSSSGNGSSSHLVLELFNSTAGVKIMHVPYTGQAEALRDVLAGRISITFSSVGTVQSHLESGRLKALAITTDTRFGALPDVPTIAESGYRGFEASAWHGLLMPASTPAAIVTRINDAISSALELPDVSSRMSTLGYIPIGGPPDKLATLITNDSAKWGKVIHDIGIQDK
ncbi:Bug family tripartite tricarboxylate transporter substrate binding protein [Pollutimonas bauzanensis]|uniref:Tripartite-type tricarboxylate transporter, receptor component TctC n=1 Tax=Pollutimonas bauzanensis TaxID=658167 RepID=A0A1M5UMB3_9BURK|nr:tripartite tricarboxylate transporter substrate binding protein [Pollutimonas bauzanensis]SHH64172.1 Tripartite-type tricarboxylate transporter, receptor component TctC [Pollutimonas bauzanensis]